MTGILISVYDNEVYEIDLDDKKPLDLAYTAMNCDLVDVVRNVKIGNGIYDILVDDEGLLKENNKPSAKCSNAEQVLFGSIIVLRSDDENGTWKSLSKRDIENINDNIFSLRNNETLEISPILEYSYDRGDDDFDIDTRASA